MINRLKYGFHIYNPMVDDFKNKYSVAYKMAEIAKGVLEERIGIEMTEDEMGFLAAYFGVFFIRAGTRRETMQDRDRLRIWKIIGRLIENQLKKVFDVEPEFEFFYGIFDENRKDDFDYIVTTTELHMDTKTPVVFMDEVFDRKYIQRKFENMRYLSEAGRTIRKGIDSLFMNLLDETRFFVLDQESSYDENVDRMARALTNQGELDAGFAQRVREREKYSTMVLDQNIAFPHTKNMLSKLTLAMGVFPDMLKDDKYGNIRIIILLGIPESMEDDTVLVRLYDDILSIGKKPDVIPKIQKMESYREFLLYIAEENNIFE